MQAILPEIFAVARIKKPAVLLMGEYIVRMKMFAGRDVGVCPLLRVLADVSILRVCAVIGVRVRKSVQKCENARR